MNVFDSLAYCIMLPPLTSFTAHINANFFADSVDIDRLTTGNLQIREKVAWVFKAYFLIIYKKKSGRYRGITMEIVDLIKIRNPPFIGKVASLVHELQISIDKIRLLIIKIY